MKGATPETASNERPITAAAQLLVEGRTPEIFFRELVQHLGLRDRINVRTFGGNENLGTWIEVFTRKPIFKERVSSLAIIRDAESEAASNAFQSVCSALAGAHLATPVAMREFADAPIRVGVYVLPDCGRPGMLETLCWEAATEADANSQTKLLPCVDEFFRCVGNAPTLDNAAKARFSAYTLARGMAETQLGRAAQKGIINFDAPAFAPLVDFLRRLAI